MASEQRSRSVQKVFYGASESVKTTNGEESVQKFRAPNTHLLRHNGASLEIERRRALKDVSEDLGHSSMATTGTVYIQADSKKRAQREKERQV